MIETVAMQRTNHPGCNIVCWMPYASSESGR